jgi:uncharacterized membrane protein YebE (DUF533 family)
MHRTIVATIATTVLLASVARAHAKTIQKHEENQEQRIEHGEESGRVTPHEAERLENQQKTIDDERARAREDGHVSKGERREIRHDQREASRTIHRKKHNDAGTH